MKRKIGVGVITCNRPAFFEKCLASIPGDVVDYIVVVNDGDPLPETNVLTGVSKVIQHPKNLGVGRAKNSALRYLLDQGADYLFLIEDDIVISDKTVFEQYIKASEVTGMSHFMYGYHGPANKQAGIPNPRLVIEYPENVKIALNPHCVGAFCFYTRDILTQIGIFDEVYFNALEHIDHSLLIVKAGKIPAYWWWPDLQNSFTLLSEQACSEVNSSIRPRPDWQENIRKAAQHFYTKHGVNFTTVADTPESTIRERLRTIFKNKTPAH